ncbi:fungal-specific transcription factor domain-containing protein [Exophiala viscosa]|uniref:Fungal-specific transcription factor domain-containing protein n=1 Tax=Exophiala viscosa TaxID=2486360 RepID=A0AAN6DWM0_9EURO|nr:fungal-specific transcription factor domain-containing protein [Exophiala viscosa]
MAHPAQEIYQRVKTGWYVECAGHVLQLTERSFTCRKRHIKCDEKKPECRNCEIGLRECQYDSVADTALQLGNVDSKFRFSAEHVWLETPAKVTFVHSVDVEFNDKSGASTVSTLGLEASAIASSWEGVQEEATPASMTEILQDDNTQILTPGAIDFTSPHSIGSGISTESADPVKSLMVLKMSNSSLYTHSTTISDPRTARLLQNYVTNLACWLDVNDPQRQFETFVPYLALSCPILLHAILAFSACHLSRLDGSCDNPIAEDYHDLCVQRLIAALADPSTTLDNVLPISTVVLRMYEMMIYDTDHQRHLRGCSALFQHNRRNIGYRALKRTAFWTYFREEIMVALSTRKPTTIRPSNWKIDITWSGDTDFVKTEKMTMLTAEIVDHCFSEDVEGNPDYVRRWDELQSETDAWKESLPETFNPLYVVEGHRPFPEMTYACTWHMIAMQFYHLVKVLLAFHNPHRPGGMEILQFLRNIEVG